MFDIKAAIDKWNQQVIEWRHHIHRNPEIGLKEYNTAAMVESVLHEAGVDVVRYPDSTAVVGILRGGKPGRCIALRADMDALPIQEETDISFESEISNVMHACGHDLHTAILMGVACILAEHKEEISGTIKFLFQHAEEYPGGAENMVKLGVLKNPNVDRVFALHVNTTVPVGKMEVTYGYSHANRDTAYITVKGKGGHGAYPHNTVDATNVGCHLGVALQSIVGRNVPPLEPAVVTVGKLHAGTTHNIVAETAELELTIRSFTQETRELLHKRIVETCDGITKAMNAEFEIEYEWGYPALMNNKEMVDLVKNVGEKVIGEENVIIAEPGMGSEDFAYFVNEVPGMMFYLGAQTDDEVIYPSHNPKFKADDRALEYGMLLMLNIAMEASEK